MSRHNGGNFNEPEHITQSAEDTLTTRLARREYGSPVTGADRSAPERRHPPSPVRRHRYRPDELGPRIRLSRVQFFLTDLSGRAELDLGSV
ncbi:baseplate assembly protein [Pseudomonas sp. Irchel 3E13]|uniref:baseplate assembly protein n=2 Tax=Pseudomonas TaxID=286 RepID=UPI003531012F